MTDFPRGRCLTCTGLLPECACTVPPGGLLRVTSLASVVPESVSWLWPGRIPLGKLTVLDGDPGVGKSCLTLDWAARVTTGRPWPAGAPCEQGGVVLLSAEDGPGDTIRPRLAAAEADLERIHLIREIAFSDDGVVTARPPVIPQDLPRVDEFLAEKNAAAPPIRLMIIDVLMAYLDSSVKTNSDSDIRRVLHRLSLLAERHHCAIVVLRHLNKSVGGSPLYRGGGSIGIIGAARAGFVAAADPEDATRCVFAATKSNLAVAPESLNYRLVPSGDSVRVEWLGPSRHNATDLLRFEEPEERTERAEAIAWLTDFLEQHGTTPAHEVKKHARAEGIAERTLHRARHELKIDVSRTGFPATSRWALPNPPETDKQDPVVPRNPSCATVPRIGVFGTTEELTPATPASRASSAYPWHGGTTGTTEESVAQLGITNGLCVQCEQPFYRSAFGGAPLCQSCQPHPTHEAVS